MTETQLEIFPDKIRIERREPEFNRQRYYRMYLQPDLFGEYTLFREWGRIGTGGRQMCEKFADEGQAVDALMQIMRRKTVRGYQ